MTTATNARVIARTELRRRWRALQGNTTQLLATAFAMLVMLPFSLVAVFGAYLAGAAIAEGTIETPLMWARMGVTYAWIFAAAFGGYRAYATALRPDNLDGLLTTVSHRTVLWGLVLAELSLWTVAVVTVGGGLAVAFGVGAGSAVAVPFVLLALVLVLATGVPTGFALALAVRNAGVRSVNLARLRTVLLGVLAVGYFVVLVTNSVASVLQPLYRLLEPTPVTWVGDLAMIGLDVGGSLPRAGGAVVLAGLSVVAVGVVLPRLAEWLWYADGVHVEHEVEYGQDDDPWLARLLSGPTYGVVAADWKRARRSPLSLSFALYPLFVLLSPLMTTIETGSVGTALPIWVLVCGTWVTGSLFALNLLGHEGAALPVTLLTATPGRSLVVGHVLAGALVLTPVTVGATLVAGVLSPHAASTVVTLSASALVLSIASGAIATGIGVAFPRFEAVAVARSTKAVVPSLLAFVTYSGAVLGVALPTVLGHSAIVGHAIESMFGIDQITIATTGTGVSALLAVGLGIASSSVATKRIDAYRID